MPRKTELGVADQFMQRSSKLLMHKKPDYRTTELQNCNLAITQWERISEAPKAKRGKRGQAAADHAQLHSFVVIMITTEFHYS